MTRDTPREGTGVLRSVIRDPIWFLPRGDLRLRPEERALLLAWWRDCDDPEERRALAAVLGLGGSTGARPRTMRTNGAGRDEESGLFGAEDA